MSGNIKKAIKAKEIKATFAIVSSPFNAKQLLHIAQATPPEHTYRRPGKGGRQFTYVTGYYMKSALNVIFGYMWSFEVKQIIKDGTEGHIVVLGKLIVKDKKGIEISKEQFGRADVKYLRDKPHKPENMVDLGNDFKAAATDALKKCASEFGIAGDVYGREEFQIIKQQDPDFNETKIEKEIKAETLDKTVGMIRGLKKAKELEDLRGKIEGSKIYAKVQKRVLVAAIDETLAKLKK